MRYRIEYSGDQKCTFADGRKALLKELQAAAGVTDIRKIYSNGTTDSVMEKYQAYITGGNTPWKK